MHLLRPALGGLVAAAALALPATASAAGSYSVYACKGPTGTAAPAAGWTANRESDAFATNDCATNGPLAVGLTGIGPWKGGIGAEQRFVAPANTRIQSLTLTRKTVGLPGAHGLPTSSTPTTRSWTPATPAPPSATPTSTASSRSPTSRQASCASAPAASSPSRTPAPPTARRCASTSRR